jgi:hypothetical protein
MAILYIICHLECNTELDVTEETFPTQFDKLWLLSKEAWKTGELKDYVKWFRALGGLREALADPKSRLQQAMRSMMKRFLGRKATVEDVQTALSQALEQIQAAKPTAKRAELALPTEWEDGELQSYLSSSRKRFPLEYTYYAVLTKHDKILTLDQLSEAMTEHAGKEVDGRNIRGMLGGINRRVEQKMKKERLDIKEGKNFSANPKYKAALRKYLV